MKIKLYIAGNKRTNNIINVKQQQYDQLRKKNGEIGSNY